MAETLAPVVEVNIGKSKETIKGLRESISKLRDQILNLTEGTDEYNEAVNQLQADQRKLDNVMALTKKTATALDGSYDALVHKMALLKKEWRATNDEARRNELGKQIDEINTRLKELDKSTGTFVRNVGNYESALDGLSDGVKDFGTQMRESMETVEPTKQQFESVSNIASGLASGFAAVKGAAALLGIENTNLEKSLVKVQAAMAIAQGIGGLKGLVEGFAKAKVAFKGLTTAVQVASKAMGATGWGLVIAAVITALTVLVSWIKKTSKEAEELKEKQDEVRQSHEEWSTSMSNSAAGLIAKYEKLREEWKSLGDDVKSRNNFIKQNQDAFEELGIKLQTIAEADKLFIDQTNDFITAVMKRATAQAYSDRLNQTAKQRVELEQTAKFNMAHTVVSNGGYTKGNNPFSYFQFTNGEIENAFSSEENLRKFYNDYLQFTKEVNGEQVPYGNKGINTWLGTAGNLVEYNVGETKENSLEMAQQLRANVIKILELYSQSKSDAKEIVKIEQELKALLGGVAGYTGGTTTTTTTTTTTASKTEDAEKKAIEGKIKSYQDFFKTKEQLLTENYIRELALAEKYGYDTVDITKKYEADLAALKISSAEEQIGILERSTQRQLEMVRMSSTMNTEEKAAKEYEILLKAENDKLALLQSSLQQAELHGLETIDIEQDIADTKIAIQRMMYDEQERLRKENEEKEKLSLEERRKNFRQTASIMSQSFSAAGDILNALTDMFQQDEEITAKEAQRIKNLRIATATMDMLSGIVGAIGSAAGMGPAGWIAGGIQAATIATVGGINIAKIMQTPVDGSTAGNGAANPSYRTYTNELPVTYTRNITSASETDSLNQDTRVYILESDIQDSNKKVQVRESESSF